MLKHIHRKLAAAVCSWIILGMVISSSCEQVAPLKPSQVSGPGNVTVSFIDMQPGQGIDYQALADEFHQQTPSITVTVIKQDHPAPLADADIAKQADVVYLPGSNSATVPGILPLQPLLEQATDFNLNDLWPGSLTACSDAQGNSYGIPLTIFLGGVYYNPAIFDQAHVSYPQPRWTWDQFREIISQLGSTTDNQTTYGFVDGPYGNILDPLLAQQISANGGQIDSQATADSLAWYLQLAKDKKLYPSQPAVNSVFHLDDMTQLLNDHQAAMWLSTTDIRQGVYLPYPVNQPYDHTNPAYANCGAISAGTKDPQAAWAWLVFLSHQDLSGDSTSGMLPGRQSLAEASPFYASLTDPEKSALQYGLTHAWYYPPGLGDTLYSLEQAIANAIQSNTDLAAALQEVASSALVQAQATPTPTPPPVALNTPVATPTNLPESVTTINFHANAFSVGARDDPLDALRADFEKTHPDINVLFSPSPKPPVSTANSPFPVQWDILQALAQDNDCFEMNGPQSFDLSNSKHYLLDLTPFLDASPALKQDFYPAFLSPFEENGKLYGLPADVVLGYIAYNADLLTKLGIPFPQPGWTFDDLLSIAAQAANLSATPPLYGFGDDNAYIFHSLNVPYIDASVQPPQATFTSDEVTRDFIWMQQLFQKGTVKITNVANIRDYHQEILNGQIAIWSTNGLVQYNTDPRDARDHPIFEQNFPFKVGYAPLPLLASGESLDVSQGLYGYYISSHSTPAKAQACWAWIQYLSGKPSVFGGYTPRQSVLSQEGVGQDPTRFEVVQEAMQQYNPNIKIDFDDPQLHAYTSEMIGALDNIFNGADVLTTLAEAQRVSNSYRACIGQKDLTGLEPYQIWNLVMGCYVPLQPFPTPPP